LANGKLDVESIIIYSWLFANEQKKIDSFALYL